MCDATVALGLEGCTHSQSLLRPHHRPSLPPRRSASVLAPPRCQCRVSVPSSALSSVAFLAGVAKRAELAGLTRQNRQKRRAGLEISARQNKKARQTRSAEPAAHTDTHNTLQSNWSRTPVGPSPTPPCRRHPHPPLFFSCCVVAVTFFLSHGRKARSYDDPQHSSSSDNPQRFPFPGDDKAEQQQHE
ncbi:hypothetical protein PIB30_092946, partial [Stylosanthes scabra]|nr:hypothetical protein [Stylosanthes scabra]